MSRALKVAGGTDPSALKNAHGPGQEDSWAALEVQMQAFITEAANQPGEFARHAEAIAKRGVNLSGVVCLGLGDRGGAAFMAADESGLRTALNEAGFAFREIPIVTIAIDDKPGTVAAAARKLGDAGVNIDLMAGVGMTDNKVTLAIGVDKVDEARQALGDLVTEWSASRVTAGAR